MAEHLTETQPDGVVPALSVPAALGSLIDAVMDDDQQAGGRTRPPALLAAAVACALVAAVLAGSVAARADAHAPNRALESALNR